MRISLQLRGHRLSLDVPSGSPAGHLRRAVSRLPQLSCDVSYLSLYDECGLPLADAAEIDGDRYVALVHLHPLLRFVVAGTGEVREVYRPTGVLTGAAAYEAFAQSEEDVDAFLLLDRGEYVYEEDVLSGEELEVQWRLEEEPEERE